MKIRNGLTISFLLAILGQTAQAQEPLECIENPKRELACERLILKKTDPNVMRNTPLESPTVCICIADFMPDKETGEMPEQADAWLNDWGLTHQDLVALLRY